MTENVALCCPVRTHTPTPVITHARTHTAKSVHEDEMNRSSSHGAGSFEMKRSFSHGMTGTISREGSGYISDVSFVGCL